MNFNNKAQYLGKQVMQANSSVMPADVPNAALPLLGPSTFFDPSKPFGQYARSHHGADIARFRCKILAIGAKKKNEALIDSGTTHNFFYDKELFVNYEPMEKEKV